MKTELLQTEGRWILPPLILHPFSDAGGPQALARSSRAGLILEGLAPQNEMATEELERTLLKGRLCEIRMLFYVGKDLQRWIEQCVEFCGRQPELANADIGFDSIAQLLIEDPPAPVREKLSRWGVADYPAIFSRALAMRTLFAEAPVEETLGAEFIRNYFRFADQIYACRRTIESSVKISPENFEFELYASGEYSRMLEREWA